MKQVKSIALTGIILLFCVSFSQAQGVKYVKIKTSAVSELCKKTIEDGLKKESGVKEAVLDLSTKTIAVKYDSNITGYDKICSTITGLGYDADDQKADAKAFSNLPNECKPIKKSGNTNNSGCGNHCTHSCGSH